MSGYEEAISNQLPPTKCVVSGDPLNTAEEEKRGVTDAVWQKFIGNKKFSPAPPNDELMREAIALAPEPLKKEWTSILSGVGGDLSSPEARMAMVVVSLKVGSMALSYGADGNKTSVIRVDSAMLAIVCLRNFAQGAGWTNISQSISARYGRELKNGILRFKNVKGRPGVIGIHAPYDKQWNDICFVNKSTFFGAEKEPPFFWRYFHESDMRTVVNLLQSCFGDALAETSDGKMVLLPSMPLPDIPQPVERARQVKEPKPTDELPLAENVEGLRVGDKVELPDGSTSIIQFIDSRKSKVGVGAERGSRSSYLWFSFSEMEKISGKQIADELYRRRLQDAANYGRTESSVDKVVLPPLPAKVKLLSNQIENIEFIYKFGRVLIADEPGLGKTGSACLAMETPAIIVCPAHLKDNWKREICGEGDWPGWRPELSVLSVSGGDTPKLDLIRKANVVLINYEVVEKHLEWLQQFRPKMIIADEAHYLKTLGVERDKNGYLKPSGTSSVRAGAFYQLHFAAPKLVLLTGTPVLNRTKELFPLLHMLDIKAWPNQREFEKKYCGAHMATKGGMQVWDANGRTNTQELHEKIKGKYMIRHTKADVLKELPEKSRKTLPMSMEPKSLDLYRKVQDDFIGWLESQGEAGKKRAQRAILAEALVRLTELRKISAFGKAPGVALCIRDFFNSTVGTRPLVVMGVFKEPLKRMAKIIDGWNEEFDAAEAEGVDTKMPRKIRYEMYTGEQRPKERADTVRRFQDGKIDVIFYSIPLGTGVTLTASSDMFFIERIWRPADLVQAEDRIHRIGQQKGVQITYFDCPGTIDSKLAMFLMDKTDTAASVIDGMNLTRAELFGLVFGDMAPKFAKEVMGGSIDEMSVNEILDDAYASRIDLDRQAMNGDGSQEGYEDKVSREVNAAMNEIERERERKRQEKAKGKVKKNRGSAGEFEEGDFFAAFDEFDMPFYTYPDDYDPAD